MMIAQWVPFPGRGRQRDEVLHPEGKMFVGILLFSFSSNCDSSAPIKILPKRLHFKDFFEDYDSNLLRGNDDIFMQGSEYQ